MGKYNSITEIRLDFDISNNEIEDIQKELEKIRVEYHPDKTGGEFQTDDAKEKYHNADEALNFIETLKSNQSLMVIEKMTDLMKKVTDLIPSTTARPLENTLDTNITNSISSYRSKYLLPKISLTAITAIVTFVFLFPKQISDNPTLSSCINPQDRKFAIAWFVLLFYCIIFWIYTFKNEERAKRTLVNLKVDSFQNRIFEDFLEIIKTEKQNDFTKDRLTNFIYYYHYNEGISIISKVHNKIFGSEIVTMEIAQNIAEFIIQRAEKNGVISKVTNYSLSETFRISNYR
jgi:ABC-type multidrug transport system fused ATPase/permease subunit